jgi:hypothetical protein
MPNKVTIIGVAGVIHEQIVALARASPGPPPNDSSRPDCVEQQAQKTVDDHLFLQGGPP